MSLVESPTEPGRRAAGGSKAAAGETRKVPKPREPLDIYLRDVESHDLLAPEEERDLLRRLIDQRDAWLMSFLHSEGALEAAWLDLQVWAAGEMSASRLVPGPPRLKPGQIGPDHHVPRLYRLFETFVGRHGPRPFRYQNRRQTKRLVRALNFIGLRPKPLGRYRDAAIERHGGPLSRRVDDARQLFIETRQPLIERNLRLVLKVAWGYIPGPMSFDELIQEGNIGLLRATESFNGRFQVRFSTYAYLWIRQSVIRALEEKSRMIRLPVHLTHLLRKVSRDRDQGEEVPDNLSFQGKRYCLPRLLSNPTVTGGIVSLDHARGEDAGFSDIIPDEELPRPEEGAMGHDLSDYVKSSLGQLPPRMREVLRLRFGIGCSRPHTLGEIGGKLGVSSERIRQIQEEALQGLRDGPDREILEELVLD